jgi:hypothetical protein
MTNIETGKAEGGSYVSQYNKGSVLEVKKLGRERESLVQQSNKIDDYLKTQKSKVICFHLEGRFIFFLLQH